MKVVIKKYNMHGGKIDEQGNFNGKVNKRSGC